MKWSIRGNTKLLIFACSATSAALAGFAGYVAADKQLEKKYEAHLEVEIQKAKELYQEMYSKPAVLVIDDEEAPEDSLLDQVSTESQTRYVEVEDPIAKALDAVHRYQPTDEDEDGRPSPIVIQNVFESGHTAPGEEVLEALLAERDSEKPYIITKEEFLTADPEYRQERFTYYEGDDILVMDSEEYHPVDNDVVAGEDNLYRFGYGSGDEWVLYIRNEELEMDLHITKSTGKYAVEVMALDDDEPHLQHSQPRRFRIRDE